MSLLRPSPRPDPNLHRRSLPFPVLLALVLAPLLLMLGATALGWRMGADRARLAQQPASLSRGLVIDQIKDAAALATLEVIIQDVIAVFEPTWERDRESLLVMRAKALIGIDLSALTDAAVQPEGDGWVITLPRPKVLEVITYPETAKAYAVRTGLLGHQVTPQRILDAEGEFRQRVRETASEAEYLHRAQTNALATLTRLTAPLGVPVRIDFQ